MRQQPLRDQEQANRHFSQSTPLDLELLDVAGIGEIRVRWLRHREEEERVLRFVSDAYHVGACEAFRTCACWEGPGEQPHSVLFELSERIIAHLSLWPKQVIDQKRLRAIGDIGTVVVDPEFRGFGLLHHLFDQTMQHAGKLGLEALVLGGKPEIYRKVGFFFNGATTEYLLNPVKMGSAGINHTATLLPGPLPLESWRELYELGLDGAVRHRRPAYWRGLHAWFQQHPEPYICLHSARMNGLLIALPRNEILCIREVLAPKPEAVWSLLSSLARSHGQFERFRLHIGTDSVLDHQLQGLTTNGAVMSRNPVHGTQWRRTEVAPDVDCSWHLSMLDRR